MLIGEVGLDGAGEEGEGVLGLLAAGFHNGQERLHEPGAGGRLYGAQRLEKLRRYLSLRGVTLEVGSAALEPGKAGAFRAAADGTARLLLKADPTNELVWHELGHFIQWRRLGSDAYRALPRSPSFNAPEQFVFDLLERPTRWRRLTPEYRIHSAKYIEEVGGFR